jgi:hypothetical protein
MAITPNYSWPLPDDTDLVKDGAEAIRDLGNAIDTTVDGLPSGGLVHINTTSFTAVASQSLDNVFTSTYDNYRLFADFSASTNIDITLRFRASGSDNSTSNYTSQLLFGNGSSASAERLTGQTSSRIGGATSGTRFTIDFSITNPNLAELKLLGGFAHNRYGGNGIIVSLLANGFNATTVFDGLSLICSTGNITGSISIFGVKK